MKVAKRIEIELLSKSFMKRIPVVQNDRGRVLECHVTDCKIPEGTKVKFWAQKPSKKLIYNDCTVKDNVVSIELTNQALAERGTVMCQLEFDGDVSSYEFALDVERDLSGNGVESENESTVLDALLKDLRDAIAETEASTQKADAATEEAKDAAEEARFAAQEVDAPIKEVKGSCITADGTFQGSAIIKEINGGTKQDKTNGYQLFDASKLPTKSQGGATVTNNGDGSFTVAGSGNLSDTFRLEYVLTHDETVKLIKQGNITANFVNVTYPRLEIILKDYNKELLNLSNAGATTITNVVTEGILKNDTFLRVVFYGTVGTLIKSGTIRPMIYQDGDGTWEPFTGGKTSPSPEYPQEIEGIGKLKDGKYLVNMVTHGRQLFDASKLPTKSQGGATVTNNGDGSFDIRGDGILTENFSMYYEDMKIKHKLKTGKVTLACVNSKPNMEIQFRNDNQIIFAITNNKSHEITLDELSKINFMRVYIYGGKGSIITETTIKPMLYQDGDGTWEPFKFCESYIPLDYPLYEGDKIYLEDGELWEYRENARVVLDGSEDENWKEYVDKASSVKTFMMQDFLNCKLGFRTSFCNKFINKKDAWIFKDYNIYSDHNEHMNKYFRPPNAEVETLEQWKTWLLSNPLEVVYKLATPTRKKLGSAEAFNLRTFDGITYIEVVGSKELGTVNTFIVPRNQSGGIMTDAFATAKRNEINMAEQENLVNRIQALEKLAVREG